jgi:hypothetical protein
MMQLHPTVILFKAFPNTSLWRVRMNGKLIALAAPAALLVSAGAEGAKDPVKLTNDQLDKVAGGVANVQLLTAVAMIANGAVGAGAVNLFSPSTATVTQTNVVTSLNLFTVD